MNSTPSMTNAASVVAQSIKDRVPGLGRGPGLDSRTSNGKLWKLLKNIRNEQPQAEQCNTILSEDGNLAVNDEPAADLLGFNYHKISRLNFSVEDRNIKIRASRIVHGCLSDTHRGTSIFSRDFRMNEFDAAIGDSCLNKSPGPDGIHGQMIDHLGLSGRQITHFSPAFPQSSPGRTVRFQKGTLYYRSASLLLQKIRDAHNRKPTNHKVAIFLDLCKDFDRVWNNLLVIKLFKNFGIGGKALPGIYDILRNRLIGVKFNNFLSISFSFFQVVPQGSVLSPTLFSIYLSCIESVIKRKCKVGAFSDDIVLWKSDSDLTKLESDINLVLEDIRNFALDHKLTFNHTMYVVSFFTSNGKLYNFLPNIFLYNHPLTIDKHPKYLGFILDPEILGNKHIDNIVFKAGKQLNILRYISGHDWGADAGTLRNTYIFIIRPILEYDVPVYCRASITNLQKLEKVEFSAARIITGLKNTCPRDIVLFKADLQLLSLRRRACLTKYYNKLRSLDSRNRTSAYFNDRCNNQRLR
ncbi:putative RNA-directed DNA polymerase from transposon BS [Trichonephila clavipes]|uniref:Putative RNA-directed DNA polymerase from transposon BS n=1 Tax=Trichonephila clavipes TaxID=2585209 RepID=A0A8X6VJ37_TRICX|nr:putative RNA-directed DNA polymerase from transposon BS [Trichonephila clavipes]